MKANSVLFKAEKYFAIELPSLSIELYVKPIKLGGQAANSQFLFKDTASCRACNETRISSRQ